MNSVVEMLIVFANCKLATSKQRVESRNLVFDLGGPSAWLRALA